MDWMKKRHFILKGIITALVLIVLFYTGRWAFFNIFHRSITNKCNAFDGGWK